MKPKFKVGDYAKQKICPWRIALVRNVFKPVTHAVPACMLEAEIVKNIKDKGDVGRRRYEYQKEWVRLNEKENFEIMMEQ